MTDWETACPAREDGLHCVHWYDGEACCSCQDPALAVLDLTFLHAHAGPYGAATVVRNNATGEVVEIPGGPFQVVAYRD